MYRVTKRTQQQRERFAAMGRKSQRVQAENREPRQYWEPVACAKFKDGKVEMLAKLPILNSDWKPLYTSPPAAKVPDYQQAKEAVRLFESEYVGQGQSSLWEWALSKVLSAQGEE